MFVYFFFEFGHLDRLAPFGVPIRIDVLDDFAALCRPVNFCVGWVWGLFFFAAEQLLGFEPCLVWLGAGLRESRVGWPGSAQGTSPLARLSGSRVSAGPALGNVRRASPGPALSGAAR